jgi:muramoyltetrapeptide carboxypeptidase
MIRRREFMMTPAVAAFAQTPMNQNLIKPRALKPGDTVGLITPSTYVCDPDRLDLARRTIEFLDLKPKMGRNVRKRAGYLGGSIQDRVDDVHAMFADPEVKAVFAIRGGYGSNQLLDSLNYELIRKNPKIFAGYSDITAMHLAINRMAGLITFHSPVTLSAFSPYTLEHFKRAIFEAKPLGKLANPPDENALRPKHPTRVLRPGKATGPLIGGNLSLVAATMGTPYEIQTEGRIVFLEDVDEQPYSMDRMLTQLRLAGKFKNIKGLVIGECADCRPREFKPSFECTFSLGEVLDHILGDLPVPVLSGLTIGHTEDQLTLPEGVAATLDADAATLTIEEPALTE